MNQSKRQAVPTQTKNVGTAHSKSRRDAQVHSRRRPSVAAMIIDADALHSTIERLAPVFNAVVYEKLSSSFQELAEELRIAARILRPRELTESEKRIVKMGPTGREAVRRWTRSILQMALDPGFDGKFPLTPSQQLRLRTFLERSMAHGPEAISTIARTDSGMSTTQ